MQQGSKAGLRSRSRSRKESEVFRWSTSRTWIPNNIGSRSRIFLSDSGCPIGSFFSSHSWIRNYCWNGTISFETFVETDISCCAPRFPLILTAKFHSLYVKESESEILGRSESGVGDFGKSESEILPPAPQPWSKNRIHTWSRQEDVGFLGVGIFKRLNMKPVSNNRHNAFLFRSVSAIIQLGSR